MKSISELRQDIVSGDWVVIATGRGKRPDDFALSKNKNWWRESKKNCPFDTLFNSAFYVALKDGSIHKPSKKNEARLKKEWVVKIIPNKFPAFGHGLCAVEWKTGPYLWQEGVGFHDVVVTRTHDRSIAQMQPHEVELLIHAYRDRYVELIDEDCIQYISIFHNHGPEAGASIAHPHSQIIAIPVVPPDVARSIAGSYRFFRRYKKCVHCVMIEFEKKDKKRVVFENSRFIAFAPFASRSAFEIRLFSKEHLPNFEAIHHDQISDISEALRIVLKKLYVGLNNPSYNFFIHTSPAGSPSSLRHYHWHVEILPKTAIWAGFELGTGIDISTIAPEKAAAFLRGIK